MSKITTDFIKSIRKTYEEVGALLTQAKLLQRDVETIRERVVEDSEKARSDSQARDTQKNRPIIAASDAAQSKREEEHRAEEEQTLLRQQYEGWKKQFSKPKFQVSFLTLVVLMAYTCETRRANNLTQKNLEFTRSSVAAQVTIADWDFADPVVPGKPIRVRTQLNNIGHSPAAYALESYTFRWKEMPNNIPIEAPTPAEIIEMGKPVTYTMYDPEVASEEYIYQIPHFREMRVNPATRHPEPPFFKTTSFFVGRLVYDSLGLRTEKQFCFYMVYADDIPTTVKIDPRFFLHRCPKWNTTKTTPIK